MIFKQETIKSWFSGIGNSINNEVVQPFQNAEQVIWKYNQAIQHNSLTQQGWERLLAQSDDSLKAYLTSIKGTTATMTGYNVSLLGNISGLKKVSSAIAQYNVLSTSGAKEQNAFANAVSVTNGKLGTYLTGLNGAKASLSGYINSLIGATAKTVALKAVTLALNATISMGITAGISLAVKAFDNLMNSAKRASDAANEAFSETNQKVQKNKEELKTLDELSEKYKELKENGNLDIEGRKEVKKLQNDIADLVGTQAKNLDLVNGKLDEEIKKLNEISSKEAKSAYETATANYNNAKKATNNAAGDSSIAFVDGYAYVGKREKEAEKILQEAGFIDYYYKGGRKQTGGRGVGNNGLSTIVFDTYDKDGKILKGAQEKADYLQSMIDVLEQNGQRTTDLYSGLIAQRDTYLKYIDNQQSAANSLVESWITYSQYSNEQLSKINVDSLDSFEDYRQQMIEEAKKDESIGQMLADGVLSESDLENTVDAFMATASKFSTWYEQWTNKTQNAFGNETDNLKLFDQLTSSKESLDKFQSSVESAYDSYAKLMNPDISSSDILSSIQSITSAVSDMDGSLNWEFIDGQSNSLELLGNAIEEISRKYAESVLSGAGIDIDSKFGQMLANNIIQAQKASIELENLNDGLDSLQSAYSSLTDIVEAYNETGYLTFDQLQTLLELEPQYLACLIDENGQLQLNEQAMSALANQRLNDAEAQAVQSAITELGQLALQDEQKAVEDNATAFTNAIDDLAGYNQELANTIAEATVGASAIRDLNAAISGAQSQGATDDQINTVLSNLETKLKLISDVRSKVQSGGLGEVANPTKSKSGSEKDTWLEEYKKRLSELENMLDKGLITQREFYDQSEMLLNQYLKDTPEHIEKYAEEISDAEKTLHDNWISAYESEADQLTDLRDKHLINMADYYKSMMDLQDEYYNSEALKLTQLADKMEAEYGRMNSINLTRPSIDASAMQEAGYATELQSSSVYAQSFGDTEKQVVVTPILPDGTILSPTALADYANKLLSGEKIDTNIELAMFDGKDAVKQATEYINGLEGIQSEYQKLKSTLSQNPYGDFTEEQLKVIEQLSEELDNVMSQLSGELGDIKSAYDDLIEIRDTYNEYGKISVDQYQSLCDMGFQYLALLSDENGALSLDEEAFQRLTDAKIQEMQVTMALQAADLISSIKTEEDAIRQLAASYTDLSNNALSAAENMMYAAKQKLALEYGESSLQVQAADNIIKGYQNSKMLAGVVDIKMQSGGGYKEDKEKEEKEDKYSKDFNWIERLLERLSKATEKITKTIEKYINYVKKNNAINRAVKSIDAEVTQNRNAYDFYMSKAREVGLDAATVRKIQNGSIDAETITNEGVGGKIEEYMEWYDKAQDVKDAIDDLFEQQRDLISQKLDNILDYYSDMDSYLSSITSKVESLISLNDEMGKRSSLTELVEQFANLNKQIESVTAKGEAVEVVKKQIASGTAESVQKAVADDNAKESERIQSEIQNLDVTQSGTYQKLLKDIEKTQAKIAQYEEKGWDVKKVKQYEKLQKQLENYYAQQEALDNDATSNTVANYSKVYLAWQKLMNNTSYQKLLAKESDGTLKANEQKRLDKYNKQLADYEAQMEKIKNEGQSEIDALLNQLSVINGTAENTTEAQKIQKQINDIEDSLQNTAIYQNLVRNIEDAQNKIAELDAIGYDNLTKKQKKTYDKLTATLESYYAQKESLDQGATASNIAEYNKIYLAWKKMQDKLDAGKNLSNAEWQRYDSYTKQLENWVNDKATQYEELNSQLQDALNPPDKQGVIKKEYEESSKQMYDSYQNQIDAINSEVRNTQNYKNLLANIRSLEQKKDTKGLSKSDEDKLKKYQAELDALEKGGTSTNVVDYMKTWEAWYKLQQKLDNGKNLSASEASKYDEYRAKLEAWNKEKQTQINDLFSQMEDDLEKLNKTYTENVSEAESEIDEYYANLYNLAKQIAEYNINALEQQLSVIQSMVSYYQNLAGLYETFSGDKLSRLLVDLDEDTALSKLEIYQKELSSLNEQYDVNKNKMKEYQQLLDALDTNNFASSMALFNKVLNDSSVSQATKDNLQQVIDLLNERALSADNWGEYADQWENEWQQALADTKQSLIEVAGSIQEVNDAIRETSFESLNDAITQLGYLKDTLSSVTGLINDDWIFDEDGELTEYGNAKVSLLVEQMQTAREEADKYAQQISAIMSMRDTYSSENAYQTALQEAKSNYLSSLNELKGFEDSVVSIMTQSNETIVNSLKDVISARIKALKAQKELYEYNKSITNSQKEIDNIKAQIDALENLTGATDAATKAKLAQLKADLEEKETALKDMKDDHTYNLQIDALEEFMNTLDQTMSDAADAVNKSFAAYKEAIDSALNVYEKNKDYLGEWSNTIMKNVLGLVNTNGTNTVDVDIQQSDSGESQSNLPTIKVENSDTVSAIESSNGTIHGDLIDIKTAIEQGIIVKVDSPLTALNPEMMNFVRNYVPPMTNAVVNTLPQIAERRNVHQPIIQNHYDCLLKVEGSVDKDFAKVLPDYLEKSFKYTADKMYREQVILNGGNRRIRR